MVRAPRETGTSLIVPPRASVEKILSENVALRQNTNNWNWLIGLAYEARPDMLLAAANYTGQYRNVSQIIANTEAFSKRVIMSGHQPELFHAGVWFKNFLLSALAQDHGAIAVNLIVDNDLPHSASVRVPCNHAQQPSVESVMLQPDNRTPTEENQITDGEMLHTFPQRVATTANGWLDSALLPKLWEHIPAAQQRSQNLGRVLGEARHKLEETWGLSTLEVPLSLVYKQAAFVRFVWRLFQEPERLFTIYNRCLHAFRVANKVRSKGHPVPDLVQRDDWFEMPFWIWTKEQPSRQKCFLRRLSKGVQLSGERDLLLKIPVTAQEESLVVEQFAAWERRGIKLRPRALMTTCYARLVLSDLFIHGIGGAKYDELTNAIIQDFFGITPPQFLTATATVQLPLQFPEVHATDVQQAQQHLRDLRYHAEVFSPHHELSEQKQALLQQIPVRGHRKTWHVTMQQLQQQLAALHSQDLLAGLANMTNLQDKLRLTRLLKSREFCFAFFEEHYLRQLLLDLANRKV